MYRGLIDSLHSPSNLRATKLSSMKLRPNKVHFSTKPSFLNMATFNVIFIQAILLLVCFFSYPTKGLAAMFKGEACVLSVSPFVHLNCSKEFVKIKEAHYSTVCASHGCRVKRHNIKCKPEVSNECWIMVEQIPLVECGNYYSLFLEIEYDCVKDPLEIRSTTRTVGMPSSSTKYPNIYAANSTVNAVEDVSPSDSFSQPSGYLDSESGDNDSSLSAVTATLHRGPLESNLTSRFPAPPEDVAMTTASRPLSTTIERSSGKPTSPPKPVKSRRPLGNGATAIGATAIGAAAIAAHCAGSALVLLFTFILSRCN